MSKKEYIMSIKPEILKLLGPNLYTNIYYILSELIANSWDADANNVYIIIKKNGITIEDDGSGMSYKEGEINKFLTVALESRKTEKDSFTKVLNRKKMGRKGVGKLSALSISDNVKVMSIKNGEKSGFIMTTNLEEDGILQEIPDNEIIFNKIQNNGTSIHMENPKYLLNKKISTISSNIARVFPIISESFKIHIIKDGIEEVITNFEQEIFDNQLAAIITLGEEFKNYSENIPFKKHISGEFNTISKKINGNIINLNIKNKVGKDIEKKLVINGWIGAYKHTKNRKKDIMDFQDNFLSIYSNGKLGQFNILPRIGQNKLIEVYIVGQIHVDLFEDTDLPDMALSNRQDYKTDDLRYVKLEEYLRILLNEIIELRGKWSDLNNLEKNQKKEEIKLKKEAQLKETIQLFRKSTEKNINEIIKNNNFKSNKEIVSKIMDNINVDMKILGIKAEVDSNKKKILLSHTSSDKFYSDLIYEMLKFNGIPADDFIYSSSDDEEARIGENKIYEYLRNFFVDSYSNEKIHVIYVTSENISCSWGAITEVGAGWITQSDNDIFNINNYKPSAPLNIESTYIQVTIDENDISFKSNDLDEFCKRIEKISLKLGYKPKTREQNKNQLQKYGVETINIKLEFRNSIAESS